MTAPRILAFPADQGGCGFYRLIAVCRHLVAQGAEVDYVVDNDPPERQLQALWWERPDGTLEVVDVIVPDADVVVLQRPLAAHLSGAIEILQRKGVRVVVEIDDDFEHISPRNVSWKAVQPHLSPRRNRAHLARACELADLVTVSTPALARLYGHHGRVAILPNCVPSSYLRIRRAPRDDDALYVGWTGSIETHPDDLQVTGRGVARAIDATGARMAVVGTGKGVRKALGLRDVPLAAGWRPLHDYPEALAQFDVGIVPLEQTPFNEAKSALKMMEMAAVGVPVIASPTSENLRMHAEGIGAIARTPREWEGLLKSLLRSADRRAEMAHQGREAIKRWTVETNAWRWLQAWEASMGIPSTKRTPTSPAMGVAPVAHAEHALDRRRRNR